jgi:hypothetical protein
MLKIPTSVLLTEHSSWGGSGPSAAGKQDSLEAFSISKDRLQQKMLYAASRMQTLPKSLENIPKTGWGPK